jgi:hypothetical protein
MNTGTVMSFTRRFINNEVWLPARVDYTIKARVLMLKRYLQGGHRSSSRTTVSSPVDTATTIAPPADKEAWKDARGEIYARALAHARRSDRRPACHRGGARGALVHLLAMWGATRAATPSPAWLTGFAAFRAPGSPRSVPSALSAWSQLVAGGRAEPSARIAPGSSNAGLGREGRLRSWAWPSRHLGWHPLYARQLFTFMGDGGCFVLGSVLMLRCTRVPITPATRASALGVSGHRRAGVHGRAHHLVRSRGTAAVRRGRSGPQRRQRPHRDCTAGRWAAGRPLRTARGRCFIVLAAAWACGLLQALA